MIVGVFQFFKIDALHSLNFKYLLPFFLIFAGCSGFWPFGERNDFVRVQGTHFFFNDRPYYFVGTNLWYACYLGSPGKTGNRPRLLRELDSLKSIGITNIRLLAGSELSAMKRTLKPSIIRTPGTYDDTLLLGLDFTIAELTKRKMKAVLFFTNYWEWSGGLAQYIVWADSVPTFDPVKNGWDAFMNFSASFYKNQKANSFFRSYIKTVIGRKNIYNGKFYSEDPTIMSWQLANEPRSGTIGAEGVENMPYFLQWIDETAAFVKSLDSNHLISTGSEGIIGSLRNEEYYRAEHSSKHIDYFTMHLWPSIWKWFDPQDREKTLPAALDSSSDYIIQHLRAARIEGKPLVLEEFGMVRDDGKNKKGTPTTVRNIFYNFIFSMIYDSARTGSPIAGSNFWAWGGEGKNENPDGMWKEGDDFTGDPPHEPQGLHSVFNTDSSTIAVLREYSAKMNRLGKTDPLVFTNFNLQNK